MDTVRVETNFDSVGLVQTDIDKLLTDLGEKIKLVQMENTYLKEENAKQKKLNEQFQRQIKDLTKRNEELETKVTNLITENNSLRQTIVELMEKNEKLTKTVNDILGIILP